MWSAGCTLYELIAHKPLFKAASYQELTKMYVQVLGKPDAQYMASLTNKHALEFINSLPQWPKKRPTANVAYPNGDALDLIDRCLEFDPAKRITVDEALNHAYLRELHAEIGEPVSTSPIPLECEDKDLSEADLFHILVADINAVNQSKDEEVYVV